jgi:hypothetical protein
MFKFDSQWARIRLIIALMLWGAVLAGLMFPPDQVRTSREIEYHETFFYGILAISGAVFGAILAFVILWLSGKRNHPPTQ